MSGDKAPPPAAADAAPPPQPAAAPTAPTTCSGVPFIFGLHRPAFRVTTEYDSDRSGAEFIHKVSCRVLGGLAKLRLALRHGRAGFSSLAAGPEVGLFAPHLGLLYDAGSGATRARASVKIADSVRLAASHDLKEQQGEVAVLANLGDSPCKIELSSTVPPAGLPKATLFFPDGEVTIAEKRTDESENKLSVSGIVKSRFLNGVCTTIFNDYEAKIRYAYKDEELTFVPTISLPSNALSFAFKRQFSPSNKLSYWYHFASADWSVVYKRHFNKDLKLKTGYDSDVRLGWASLWIGGEDVKTKAAPRKTKVQIMVQVPQDAFQNPVLLFRVKKRWDF